MTTKYKIIALFGPAGSGKDYIQKHLMQTIWGKTHLHEIISSTTRPPREGEVNGVDYYFLSCQDFMSLENLQKWVEFTSFRNWFYGTSIDALVKDKINIGVFNIEGITSLLEDEECEVIPILIKASDRVRIMRQMDRETSPDYEEMCRRFLTDKKDFKDIPFSYYIVENNTDEINPVLHEVYNIMKEGKFR